MVPFDVGHDLFPAGRDEFIQAGLQPLAEKKVFNPQGHIYPIISGQGITDNLAESRIGRQHNSLFPIVVKDSHGYISHDVDEARLIIDRFFPPRFLTVLIVLTKNLYVFIGHGLAKIIALYLFTANLLQEIDLGLRLCPFGQGMDTQFLGHEDDGLEDAAALFIEIA